MAFVTAADGIVVVVVPLSVFIILNPFPVADGASVLSRRMKINAQREHRRRGTGKLLPARPPPSPCNPHKRPAARFRVDKFAAGWP